MLLPRVSVVIPLYNKAATIERALCSIARQTFEDFEVIIVDDGSTDSGATLARNFSDDRIRIIAQANAGPGAARNRGIAESRAEFVTFLDADDEWLPQFIERSLASIEAAGPQVALVTSGYFEGAERRPTQQSWHRRGLQPGTLQITARTTAEFAVTVLAYLNPWATLVRRASLLRYGGFYEHGCRYGEDNYLWLKLILNERIALSLEPLVWWHSESSALSRNLAGARPIEPFFSDPAGLYATCPVELRALLHAILAIRAGKTAAVLSFWGNWPDGRRLLNEFTTLRDLRYFWVRIGHAAATPAGASAGWTLRALRRAAAQQRSVEHRFESNPTP